MEAKIFVIGFPSMKGLMEEITSLIEEAFDKPKSKKCEHTADCCFREKPQSFERDLTPPRFKNHSFMPPAPIPQWGISGKPADENLRFGAEFAIDEPRRSDYDNREDFEYDHQLFDEFVSAGEDCVERGLARPEGVTAHRCNAVRKKLNEAPPMNLDLIGETDWWNDEDFDWDY